MSDTTKPVLRWRRTARGLEAPGYRGSFLVEKMANGAWSVTFFPVCSKEFNYGEYERQRAAKSLAEQAYANQMMYGFIGWDVRHGARPNYPWSQAVWSIAHMHAQRLELPEKEGALMALLRATEIQVDARPTTMFARIPLTPGLREGACLVGEVSSLRLGHHLLMCHCRLENWFADTPQGDIAAQGGENAYWINADDPGGKLELASPWEMAKMLHRCGENMNAEPALLLKWRSGEAGSMVDEPAVSIAIAVPSGFTPIGF